MATKWGILATGRIAHTFANAVVESESGELFAVGSRTQANANQFATEYRGIRSYGTYQKLIEDSEVEAIYVSTPHPQHVEWVIKALNAKKAVLCEKPMGLNHAEVMAMVHAAKVNDVFLLEAFMYRMHPQTQRMCELLRDGAVGEIRHIHATFGFNAPFNPDSRLYASELGGGGIMDVGCYAMSMARLIAASEPKNISATGMLAKTGADLYTSALVEFENGIGAHIATGVGQQLDNSVAVYGSRGFLRIATPWLCPQEWEIQLQSGGKLEVINGTSASPYICQVNEVNRCLEEQLKESPAMSWEDSLGNANALDSWRARVNVEYPQEKADTLAAPVFGRPIQTTNKLPTDTIEGLDKDLTRVVMGCDNQPNLAHASIMFDHFVESGGNVFDTAHIYGGGRIETLLGQWLKQRGIRENIAIIGKGAHTPQNRPEFCRPQLMLTLERLQIDCLDIYFLHRDNEEVPVGEWFDVLDELRNEGLISVFGGSNWHHERISDARQYGRENGRAPGFTVVSNQFSLAEMISPVWAGCISANNDGFKRFLQTEENVALFPWSSQARGFFTSRFDELLQNVPVRVTRSGNQPDVEEMKRCWVSDANILRRERAAELALDRGVELINIALAYVLAQPFQTFPLIGPRYLWETTSSLTAFEVSLSEDELRWLEASD